MNKFLSYTLLMMTLLFSFVSYAGEIITGTPVLNMLKQGGYVVYMRHGATDHSQDDHFPVDLKDCKTQRNLSGKGVAESKNVQKSSKLHGIMFSSIVSSPFCRCIDTAKYAAGEPKLDESLYFSVDVKPEQRAIQSEKLKKMLSAVPAKGTNSLIVSHTANLQEATGIWPKPEGVAYVFKPLSDGTFEAVGKLDPQDWK